MELVLFCCPPLLSNPTGGGQKGKGGNACPQSTLVKGKEADELEVQLGIIPSCRLGGPDGAGSRLHQSNVMSHGTKALGVLFSS